MFEAVKYKYNEYDKNNKCYAGSMHFIKKNLGEENRQTVASLRNPEEIWTTIKETNITSGLAQFMRLLDELKGVKCETPRTAQNLARLYAKLNELAKKLEADKLLSPNSLAIYFFIRACGNQFKQTFETMQEEYRNQRQQCPTLAQVWQRVTRAVHIGESHIQEARPTAQSRSSDTTTPASLNTISRKRQPQNSDETPAKKQKSHRKRETEED